MIVLIYHKDKLKSLPHLRVKRLMSHFMKIRTSVVTLLAKTLPRDWKFWTLKKVSYLKECIVQCIMGNLGCRNLPIEYPLQGITL